MLKSVRSQTELAFWCVAACTHLEQYMEEGGPLVTRNAHMELHSQGGSGKKIEKLNDSVHRR